MRLFVTGGAGFIGSHYVRSVLSGAYPGAEDAEVTVFDKLTYAGNMANLAPVADSPRFRFVHGDICDPAALEAALPGHDAVLNFAAETHVDRSITGAADFAVTNFVGAQQVFDAALRHQVGRVVHVSTDEVYGTIAAGSWSEDHVLEPNSPYSAAKAGADLLARAYARTYGLPISVTRCSNNYGPYQFPEKVIPLFVTRALQGESLPLYASTKNRREWLHVADHCRAIDAVLANGRVGETYHVGSGVEADIETIADTILAELSLPSSLKTIVPDRPSHDRRYLLDSSKLRSELGWEPEISFADGMKDTVAWYRDHESWWRPLIGRSPVSETAWHS
jgi:dTDP-glucose 4,6-dehydratase